MKIKLTFVFISLFFIATYQANAQAKFIINGKIHSSENQQAVRGVNITIDKKAVGTATNRTGDFVLMIPAANLKDTLKISSIGYQTQFLPISSLTNGQTLNIALQKNTTELKEVSIAYYDPDKVIQKALSRISENYINRPHITRGFYRMYTAKGSEPLELSEAVFDVFNYGYADKRADMLKLIKARDEKNQRDFHSLEVGQKPNTIFNYDVVNHIAASGFLNPEGLKKHKFEAEGIVDVKGSPAYAISFKEIPGAKDDSYRGNIYIDTKTSAFVYIDYGLSPVGLQNVKYGGFAGRVITGARGVLVGMKTDRSTVGYQRFGNKWVLSDVVGEDAVTVTDSAMKYDFVANVKFNYQVTSVDTTQTDSFETKMGRTESINDHYSNDGEEYWKDYNTLLADYNAEDIFKHIQAVNKSTNLKDKFEEKLVKLKDKDSVARMSAILDFYHDNDQFTGTALVKINGKMILSKSYGYADKEKRTQANSHTAYRIGPVSQVFTSVIINQLAADGKLDLQSPLKKYMPYYENDSVTVDQLLSNRSGIPDYLRNEDYKEKIMTKSFPLKDMVVNFCSDTLNFKNGSAFEFSNSNFTVLALLAQEVSGKPFADLLQERIFTPLQMTDTYFGTYKGADNHQAKGYINAKPETAFDAANEAGAGGIYSSAEDMLKFHTALLTNKLMPEKQKAEIFKNRVEVKENSSWYNYGWMTDKNAFDISAKHPITYNTGTDQGFASMFARAEDADNCVILLSNNGAFPSYDMTDLILNVVK